MVASSHSSFRIPTLAALWYLGLFLFGAGLILYASSSWGIGVRVDSLSYLTAARSLAEGKCLCWLGSGLELKPLVHFGPAYPILLAAVARAVGDTVAAARLISALLYGANLVVAGLAIHLLTGRFLAGVLCTFLVGASPAIVQAHDSAMSEPVNFLMLMAGMGALALYLRGARRFYLFLAIGFSALAVLARYAGAVVIPAGVLGILALSPARRKLAGRDAALFAAGASLPFVVWTLRNIVVAGTATNRVLGSHPITGDDARKFLEVVTAWMTSAKPSHWLEGFVLGLILTGLSWLLWRRCRSSDDHVAAGAVLGLLWLIFAFLYIPYLAFSRSFLDAKIPIDDRMLSPFYLALAFAVSSAVAVVPPRSYWPWPELVGIGGVLLLLGPRMLTGSAGVLSHLRTEGVGFTDRAWQASSSIDWLRRLPPDATVYSNKAHVIQLLLERAAFQLPERYDEVKALPRSDFEQGLAVMRSDLQRPDSYLLYLDPDNPAASRKAADQFTVGLVPILIMSDGVVFATSTNGPSP